VPDFRQELALNNKKTDLLIGSFAFSLAVPTGFEPAERNWIDGVVIDDKDDCIVSFMGCQAIYIQWVWL
jgi:hypothetical protein